MESDCIALRGPRLEAAARDVNRRGQGRFRVGFSYAVATCPEPALPDQVDHQGVDQLSEHEQEVGTIERGGLLCAGPPWSRWSTLPAGWRFATRDSARGPPISLGRSRTLRDALVIQRLDHRIGRVRFPPPPLFCSTR